MEECLLAQEKGFSQRYLSQFQIWIQSCLVGRKKKISLCPQASQENESILWENTAHWDKLLIDRAAVSGRVSVHAFTKVWSSRNS
jgi:methylglutaconyl-CoA hydratase